MASVRQDKVQVEVEINGKKAGQTLKELKSDVRQLNRELESLTPGTEEFNNKAQELRAARARLKEVNDEVNKTGEGMTKLQEIGGKLKAVLAMAFAAVAAAAVAVGAKIAEIVIHSEQVEGKFRQVFGDAAGVVDEFARSNATSLGLTSNRFKELASSTGDLLVPLGLTRNEAAKMSIESVKLAGALSHWSNGEKSVAEASEILTKAMLGEKDGLQALGIKITETELQAQLLEKGQSKLTGTMLEQAKALATHELIMEKSRDAVNKFENGSQSMGQQLARAKAQLSEIGENIAKQFAPAVASVISWFGKLTGTVSDYGAKRFSDTLNEERMSVNALVRSITQQNDNSAIRDKLLGQLQAQYPNFLGNLAAEKVTNEQLLGRLKDVNEEYRKKILISAQDELVKDVLERQQTAIVGIAEATKLANEGFLGFNELLEKRGSLMQIDLTAPLEKQWEQYVKINDIIKQNKLAATDAEQLKLDFEISDEEVLQLARIEGGIKNLIGKTADFKLTEKQLAEETANYDKVLKQLGMTMDDVNKLMGGTETESAAMEKARKEAEAAAKAKEAKDKWVKDQKQFAIDMANATKNIQDLQVQLMEDPWEQKRAQVVLDTDRKIAALVGTPEQVSTQTNLLKEALLLSLQEIDAAQSESIASQDAARLQHDQEVLASQTQQMERSEEVKRLQLELQFSTQLNAEAERERALFDLRQAALNERLQLLIDNGQAESDLAMQIQQDLLTNQIQFNQQRQQNDANASKARQEIQKRDLQYLNQVFEMGMSILQADLDAKKQAIDDNESLSEEEKKLQKETLQSRATALKAFAIGKILTELAIEIAGYMASPASVASAGVGGAILGALATVRAAMAVANVTKQEFESGGVIPAARLGRIVAGVPKGSRHRDGGISLVDRKSGHELGEMEGGEPIMILSRRVYANNKSVVDRLLYSSMYQDGAPIFERGGVFQPGSAAQVQSIGSQPVQIESHSQPIVEEIAGLRQDLAEWKMTFRAYVVLNDIQEAESLDQQVKADSGL